LDRFVLGVGGPKEASASLVPGLAPDLSALACPPSDLPDVAAAGDGPLGALAGRLSDAARARRLDATAARDAFRPAASWLGVEPKALAPVTSDEARARDFADRNRLTATVVAPAGRTAIINGQCLAVGRRVEGWELVSVDRDSVVLVSGSAKVTLKLAKDAKGGEAD
jgi:hypothetical protein